MTTIIEDIRTADIPAEFEGTLFSIKEDITITIDGEEFDVQEGQKVLTDGRLDSVKGYSSTYKAWDENVIDDEGVLAMSTISAAFPSAKVSDMPEGMRFVLSDGHLARPFDRTRDGVRKAGAFLAVSRMPARR